MTPMTPHTRTDDTATTTQRGAAAMSLTARPTTTKVVIAVGLAMLLALTMLSTGDASSHREAPLIAEDPVADNTDTYAFVSPTNDDNTVLIANYIPLQAPDGGPNFYNFGDEVLYEIHVDNDGDAVADTTFQFDFTTEYTDPNSFLYAFGPIESLDSANWNLRQSYTLRVIQDGEQTVLGQNLPVPPNNLGPRSTPDYAALSDAAVQTISTDDGDMSVFAGQKDDPFWVDLGSVFDLGALRPFEGLHLVGSPDTDPVDAVAGKNTHSLAIEVPSSYLTFSDEQPVIGVWATASRRQTRTFADGSSATPVHTGPFQQVSRLGMPLTNEVVIPLGLKDTFNTLDPDQDAGALAGVTAERASGANSTEGAIPVVTDPELLDLFPVLYPDAFDTDGDGPDEGAFTHYSAEAVSAVVGDSVGRIDISTIFLQGVGITDDNEPCLDSTADGCNNVNQILTPEGELGVPAEMLRLNTAVPSSAGDDINSTNRLGVLGGEGGTDFLGEGAQPDGFPNGRRLYDDATDIELLALSGATIPGVDPATVAPLSDGVLTNDLPFLNEFPYLAMPHSGYYSPEENPEANNL